MKTKLEIIAELKSTYPTLRKGDDNVGYTELDDKEYNETIENWASNKLAKLAQTQTEAEAKAALLDRLGITEDEAKLLLS